MVECLEFISNDKNDLVSKKDYLKAIVPTLKGIRKDLLNDPLAQYKTNKIIEKINNNDVFDEKAILELDKEMSLITKTYNKLVKVEQNKIKKEVKEFNAKYNSLVKRSRISKNH